MQKSKEIDLLRRLVDQYLEACALPIQEQKRILWRKHFSKKGERPMVCIRPYCMRKTLYDYMNLECETPIFRQQEAALKENLLMQSWGEDTVPEPWLSLAPVPAEDASVDFWGFSLAHTEASSGGKNVYHDVPLKTLEDIARVRPPRLLFDERKTEENLDRLQQAVGDLIPIHVRRSPGRLWLSEIVCFLRGMEQVMLDMYDNPEWLGELMNIITTAELEQYMEADRKGYWRSADQFNYTGSLDCDDTVTPRPNEPCEQRDTWGVFHAQEFTVVSPERDRRGHA